MELAARPGKATHQAATEDELAGQQRLRRIVTETVRPERGAVPAVVFTSPVVIRT